jgi:hypothetical protein
VPAVSIFASIATVFALVPDVFPPVATIFYPVSDAAVVPRVDDVLTPVANILPPVSAIFDPISPSAILLCRGLRAHRSGKQGDRRSNVNHSTHTGPPLALGL